jgi:hypothetical protein
MIFLYYIQRDIVKKESFPIFHVLSSTNWDRMKNTVKEKEIFIVVFFVVALKLRYKFFFCFKNWREKMSKLKH